MAEVLLCENCLYHEASTHANATENRCQKKKKWQFPWSKKLPEAKATFLKYSPVRYELHFASNGVKVCSHTIPKPGWAFIIRHKNSSGRRSLFISQIQTLKEQYLSLLLQFESKATHKFLLWERKMRDVLQVYSYSITVDKDQKTESGEAIIHITPKFILVTKKYERCRYKYIFFQNMTKYVICHPGLFDQPHQIHIKAENGSWSILKLQSDFFADISSSIKMFQNVLKKNSKDQNMNPVRSDISANASNIRPNRQQNCSSSNASTTPAVRNNRDNPAPCTKPLSRYVKLDPSAYVKWSKDVIPKCYPKKCKPMLYCCIDLSQVTQSKYQHLVDSETGEKLGKVGTLKNYHVEAQPLSGDVKNCNDKDVYGYDRDGKECCESESYFDVSSLDEEIEELHKCMGYDYIDVDLEFNQNGDSLSSGDDEEGYLPIVDGDEAQLNTEKYDYEEVICGSDCVSSHDSGCHPDLSNDSINNAVATEGGNTLTCGVEVNSYLKQSADLENSSDSRFPLPKLYRQTHQDPAIFMTINHLKNTEFPSKESSEANMTSRENSSGCDTGPFEMNGCVLADNITTCPEENNPYQNIQHACHDSVLPYENVNTPPPIPKRERNPKALINGESQPSENHHRAASLSSASKEAVQVFVLLFATEMDFGGAWTIGVVILRRHDAETQQVLKKLEEECGRKQLTTARAIDVTCELLIQVGDCADGFELLCSEPQVLKSSDLQQLGSMKWIVTEFQFLHVDETKPLFRCSICVNDSANVEKSAFNSQKISVVKKFPRTEPSLSSFDAPKSRLAISSKNRMNLCQLLDLPTALDNNWKGLAAAMQVGNTEIRIIENCKQESQTEQLLQLLETKYLDKCNTHYLRNVFTDMRRLDLLEFLS